MGVFRLSLPCCCLILPIAQPLAAFGAYSADVAYTVNGEAQKGGVAGTERQTLYGTQDDDTKNTGNLNASADFDRTAQWQNDTLGGSAMVSTQGSLFATAAELHLRYQAQLAAGTTKTGIDGALADTSGQAFASWSDALTFHSPSQGAGANLIVHGALLLHGGIETALAGFGAGPSGFSSAYLTLDAPGIPQAPYTANSWAYQKRDVNGIVENDLPVERIPWTVRLQADNPAAWFVRIEVFANLSGTAGTYTDTGDIAGDFSADFSNTLLWGGVDTVTNADTGQPVTDWTVTSDSGFNYALPAPEPSSPFLLTAAAACLGLSPSARTRLRTWRGGHRPLPEPPTNNNRPHPRDRVGNLTKTEVKQP